MKFYGDHTQAEMARRLTRLQEIVNARNATLRELREAWPAAPGSFLTFAVSRIDSVQWGVSEADPGVFDMEFTYER